MSMGKFALILSILLVLLMSAAPAFAANGAIELKNAAEVDVVSTNEKGVKETRRVDAAKTKVVPGDIVIYTIQYANIGNEPATNVNITNPVPEHTVYVDKSADGEGSVIEFSVDGGKTYGAATGLKVKDAGKSRKAGAKDYTHIRWGFASPVKPGGKGSVSFRARVK